MKVTINEIEHPSGDPTGKRLHIIVEGSFKPIEARVESFDYDGETSIIKVVTEHGVRYKANGFFLSDMSGVLQIKSKFLTKE